MDGNANVGGALFNAGTTEITDSVLRENSAIEGGAIFNAGTLRVTDSEIMQNTASERGGGIGNRGSSSLIRTSLVDNTAGLDSPDFYEVRSDAASVLPSDRWLISPYLIDDLVYAGVEDIDVDWGLGGPRHVDVLSAWEGDDPVGLTILWPTPGTEVPFQAGTLTAGSIDDQSDAEDFQEFLAETLQNLGPHYESLTVGSVASIRLIGSDGLGLGDLPVEVFAADADGLPIGDRLLTSRTGSDGRVLFSTGVDGEAASGRYVVKATPINGTAAVEQVFTIAEGESGLADWEVSVPDATQSLPTQLDVSLVIDTTGSMSDELRFLKVELDSIVTRVEEAHPDIDIRFSLVVYRDAGDAYVTKSFDFTDSLEEIRNWLDQQHASGGGDYPEAMHLALEESAAHTWRQGNTAKMLFLLADAPPHADQVGRTFEAVDALREQGVYIYPVAASGTADAAEYVMRSAAFLTSGEHLFLTDNSGYGGPHAIPNTDGYDVERIDQLMIRMIDAELSGAPVAATEIIERVDLTNTTIVAERIRPPLRTTLRPAVTTDEAVLLLVADDTGVPAERSLSEASQARSIGIDETEKREDLGLAFAEESVFAEAVDVSVTQRRG